jgi:integrase
VDERLGGGQAIAGLRRVTIHSLRHTFASALIEQGHPVTEVAHRLGHSSPTITLSIYSHWFRDVKTDAVAGLAKPICASPDENMVAKR